MLKSAKPRFSCLHLETAAGGLGILYALELPGVEDSDATHPTYLYHERVMSRGFLEPDVSAYKVLENIPTEFLDLVTRPHHAVYRTPARPYPQVQLQPSVMVDATIRRKWVRLVPTNGWGSRVPFLAPFDMVAIQPAVRAEVELKTLAGPMQVLLRTLSMEVQEYFKSTVKSTYTSI